MAMTGMLLLAVKLMTVFLLAVQYFLVSLALRVLRDIIAQSFGQVVVMNATSAILNLQVRQQLVQHVRRAISVTNKLHLFARSVLLGHGAMLRLLNAPCAPLDFTNHMNWRISVIFVRLVNISLVPAPRGALGCPLDMLAHIATLE